MSMPAPPIHSNLPFALLLSFSHSLAARQDSTCIGDTRGKWLQQSCRASETIGINIIKRKKKRRRGIRPLELTAFRAPCLSYPLPQYLLLSHCTLHSKLKGKKNKRERETFSRLPRQPFTWRRQWGPGSSLPGGAKAGRGGRGGGGAVRFGVCHRRPACQRSHTLIGSARLGSAQLDSD